MLYFLLCLACPEIHRRIHSAYCPSFWAAQLTGNDAPADMTWRERRLSWECCYHLIELRKLSSNRLSTRCRPIRIILPATSSIEFVDSGESRISKTSRTPCTIFTSPLERGSLAFNLCTSMVSWSFPSTRDPWSGAGTLESQRLDLNQASRFGN